MQVLGLTVLAWGNSVGDMSTNMAMARKGLANMAMTACYAGPVFNLLASQRPLYCVSPINAVASPKQGCPSQSSCRKPDMLGA